MSYQDNAFKTVVVLNGKASLGVALNALGHALLGLAHEVRDLSAFRFLEYRDADGGRHPAISTYPVIVLKADNANQLRTLRARALEARVACNDFAASMIGSSAEAQLAQTRASPEVGLEYLAVAMFGPEAVTGPLTKRFSLYRESHVADRRAEG